MRRRDSGTDRGDRHRRCDAAPVAGAGQFPASADAAPAGRSRKPALGRRRSDLPGATTSPRHKVADVRDEPRTKARADAVERRAERREAPLRVRQSRSGNASQAFPRRVSRKDPPRGAPAPRRRPALRSPHVLRGGKEEKTRANPAPTQQYGRRSVGCLTWRSASRAVVPGGDPSPPESLVWRSCARSNRLGLRVSAFASLSRERPIECLRSPSHCELLGCLTHQRLHSRLVRAFAGVRAAPKLIIGRLSIVIKYSLNRVCGIARSRGERTRTPTQTRET